jgi:hypothetical protein
VEVGLPWAPLCCGLVFFPPPPPPPPFPLVPLAAPLVPCPSRPPPMHPPAPTLHAAGVSCPLQLLSEGRQLSHLQLDTLQGYRRLRMCTHVSVRVWNDPQQALHRIKGRCQPALAPVSTRPAAPLLGPAIEQVSVALPPQTSPPSASFPPARS